MLHKDRVSRSLRSLAFVLVALSFSSGRSLVAEGGWINDGTDAAPRLSIEQSMWAMTGLPLGGQEWSLEEKVAKIAEAGFDGIMVFLPSNEAEEARYSDLAKRHGLAITLHCAPSSTEDVERAIASAKRLGARGIVAMIRPAFVTYGEGEAKIRAMSAACDEAKIPFYVETHRGTITQDLAMTASWARFVPGIRIHADLSHYAIAYEIAGDPDEKIRSFIDAILSRTGMLDGRIGNGEQVQIDIGRDGASPHAERFAGWWKSAMRSWLEKAGPGDVFVFKSELGPPSYAVVDLEGKEMSDRWVQALVVRDLAIRAWNEAVRESEKGQPYVAKSAKALAAGEAAGGLDRESALRVESSPIRTLRGDSHKIGEFHLAGQPLQPDFDDAKEHGIKSVINLRMEQELGGLGFDEKDHIENVLGLEYHWIPVSPETIDEEMAEKLIRTLDEAAKPTLIHDSNGNRVWGVWALYVGTKLGVPFEETQRVAKEHGIPRLVIDAFVRERLESAKK